MRAGTRSALMMLLCAVFLTAVSGQGLPGERSDSFSSFAGEGAAAISDRCSSPTTLAPTHSGSPGSDHVSGHAMGLALVGEAGGDVEFEDLDPDEPVILAAASSDRHDQQGCGLESAISGAAGASRCAARPRAPPLG